MTASVAGPASAHPFMNPGYGSPPTALFTTVPYGGMDSYYPGAMQQMHQMQAASAAGLGDPYTASGLFGTPPPAVSGAAGYLYQSPSSQGGLGAAADDIRTVFISGLPHDVKERELHNLLRFLHGYEASQMNWKTGGPQGFALFNSGAAARAVVDILSGLQFDDGVLLRAEMAHKNMFIKPEDPSVRRASKHSPTALLAPAGLLSPVAPMQASGLGAANPLSPGGPAFLAAAAAAAAAGSPTAMALPGMFGPLRPATFSPVTNLRDNPPCNTLFIGNLGDNTNEQELRVLMGSQPGYRQLKMVRGTKSTTAFVEFVDVTSAMMVHDTLQGAVLSSSDRGGIRIQYSRNPFGRREAGSSSAGLPDPMGTPVHDTLAATLAGTGNNSPRTGLSSAGLLGSLAGSAASSAGGPAGIGGSLAPVLVGQAGLEQLLGNEV